MNDWLSELLDRDPDGLRYYQREAVERIDEAFKEFRAVLLVMATGLGKTQIFSAIAKDYPGNVLVLAHRDELVEQARKRLEQMTGELVQVEQGPLHSDPMCRLVVGSIDSIRQKRRLERLGADRFDLIIIDEAHHYTAPTYLRALRFFASKLLGVTATPKRRDNAAMGQLFDCLPYVMDLQSGIETGYLVPVKGRRVRLAEIKIDDIKKIAGDLSAAQLDEKMLSAVEGVVKETLRLEPDRQGLAFFPGVKSAQLAAERFNALRPGSAAVVHGKTEQEERRRTITQFREGRLQYLCNCMVATEGFDAPPASLIIQARPTLSLGLYTQMVGRGSRTLPGVIDDYTGKDAFEQRREAIERSKKPDCMILDFCGNSDKHELISPQDLLGGTYSEDVRKRARKTSEKEGGDVLQGLEKARQELEALQKAARIKSSVRSEVRTFDPFRSPGSSSAGRQKVRWSRGAGSNGGAKARFVQSRVYSRGAPRFVKNSRWKAS